MTDFPSASLIARPGGALRWRSTHPKSEVIADKREIDGAGKHCAAIQAVGG